MLNSSELAFAPDRIAGAVAWHLAFMWLLVGNGLVYVIYGLITRHFRRSLLPLRPTGLRCRNCCADGRSASRG